MKSACEVNFQFKSKHERHLLTLVHKRNAIVYGIMSDTDQGNAELIESREHLQHHDREYDELSDNSYEGDMRGESVDNYQEVLTSSDEVCH